jgi:hypothetical protein
MRRGIEDYAKDTIRRLVPGVQDAGLLRTILEARWREDYTEDEVAEGKSGDPPMTKATYVRDMSAQYRTPFLCDMYFVAPELQTYWLYEIEDTNPISRDKLKKLRLWIDYFGDETEWAGRLIVTDRWGRNHRCVYHYEESTDDETPAQPLFPPTYQADATSHNNNIPNA